MAASETIARYRKEMMELVRDVPDYAFELSLRDIVDLPTEKKQVQNTIAHEEKELKQKKEKKRETYPRSPFMLNMFIWINSSKIKSGGKQNSKPVDKREITGCFPSVSFITNWSRGNRISSKNHPSHKVQQSQLHLH